MTDTELIKQPNIFKYLEKDNSEQPSGGATTAQQEPVATVTSESGNLNVSMSWWHEPALPVGTKLYTSPPTLSLVHRKPLTDEQIDALMPEADGTAEANKVWVKDGDFPYCEYDEVDAWSKPLVIQIARAIEAAHGIKEKNSD